MNESELSHALRGTVAAGSPPLALDSAGMLAQAKRARVRRRASFAAITSAVAVCALAGASALTGNLAFGSNHGGTAAGGGTAYPSCPAPSNTAIPVPSNTQVEASKMPASGHPTGNPDPGQTGTPTPTAPYPSATGCVDDTETPWPSGQSDRTATSGPHAEQAAALQDAMLSELLPAGATAVKPSHQAQYEESVGASEIWEYLTLTGVRRPGSSGVASLIVRVESARPGDRTDLCVLARYFQSNAQCTITPMAGTTVAVATLRRSSGGSGGYEPQPQTWIVYRAPDGNVLYLAEGLHYSDYPTAKTPLYTAQQLAEIAVSGHFTG